MNLHKSMKMIDAALRSLLDQKLRSLLSVLGVVCGVMAVVAMIAIGEGAKKETMAQIGQLGTQNIFIRAVDLTDNQVAKVRERQSLGLTMADLQRIGKACPTVDKMAGLRTIRTSLIGLPEEITP